MKLAHWYENQVKYGQNSQQHTFFSEIVEKQFISMKITSNMSNEVIDINI